MSLYCVSIDGREYRVNLSGGQGVVDGTPIQLDLTRLNESGLHLLRRDRQAVEMHLSSPEPDTYEVLVNGRRLLARVETLQKRLRRRSDSANSGTLAAPMPGLVVQVLVQEGEQVESGQTLAVLKSMKMQMQLRATAAGRVTAVAVQAGQQVEKGTLLVRVEPESL